MTDTSLDTHAGGAPPGITRRAARPRWLAGVPQWLPCVLVPLLFVALIAFIPGYLTKNSIISLLILASLLGLSSLGQTMTIIAGGLDLSIPAVIGLADIILTQLYQRHWPLIGILASIAALAIGIGAINALASVALRVHSLIISFGMSLIVGGVALLWSNGVLNGAVPAWLTSAVSPIGRTAGVGVPLVIIVWVVAAALAVAFLRLTRIGRETYALGASPVAARLAGVRSTWTLVVAFCISALCAALVGVFFAGYSAVPDSTVGQPYFFLTITAVIVGGTSLLGGRGGYLRTVLGALIVAELTTLLVGVGFNSSFQELGLGILVILLTSTYGREISVAAKI